MSRAVPGLVLLLLSLSLVIMRSLVCEATDSTYPVITLNDLITYRDSSDVVLLGHADAHEFHSKCVESAQRRGWNGCSGPQAAYWQMR